MGTDDWRSLAKDFARLVRSNQTQPVIRKAFGSKPLVGHAIVPVAPSDPVLPPLSSARIQRIEDLLTDVARMALAKAGTSRRGVSQDHLVKLFVAAIEERSDAILKSSKVNRDRIAKEQLKFEAEKKAARKAARKSLADELRSGKARLRKTIKALRIATLELTQRQARAGGGEGYPQVPIPSITPHKDGAGLPAESGVYFLWNGEVIEYVGKSTKLCNRVKLGSHQALRPHHRISYILIDKRLITWAECYYLGILQPVKNFGLSTSAVIDP